MIKREMDNRGSKCLNLIKFKLKEQRVDGKLCNKIGLHLRYTLLGFERNRLIKILSNLIIIRRACSTMKFVGSKEVYQHTSSVTDSNLNPWFIAGLADGECYFMVRIRKNSKYRTGWLVSGLFSIVLHKKDLQLLKEIQIFFGGIGKIHKNGTNTYSFRVESLESIWKVLIPFFDQYPLITQKLGDYLLFKDVIKIIKDKAHLTEIGLAKIVELKASLNKGLSDELKTAFPQCVPAVIPIVVNKKILHPQWLAGFASGEGCFQVKVIKPSSTKIGFQVILVFKITQHARDIKLLKSLIDYLGCGVIEKDPRGPYYDFSVYKFLDNYEKILPFFHNYTIKGVKFEDFKDWSEVAKIMQTNKHKTKEGLDKILLIKSRMNKGRIDPTNTF